MIVKWMVNTGTVEEKPNLVLETIIQFPLLFRNSSNTNLVCSPLLWKKRGDYSEKSEVVHQTIVTSCITERYLWRCSALHDICINSCSFHGLTGKYWIQRKLFVLTSTISRKTRLHSRRSAIHWLSRSSKPFGARAEMT